MKYQAVVFAMLAGCSGNVEIASCQVGGGGKKQLDRDKLLAGIEAFANERATPPRALRCPEHLQWVVGKSFECQADLAGGTVSITVEMEADYAATVRWTEQLIAGSTLETEMAARAHVDAVACGDQILFHRPDSRVTCVVTRGAPGTVTASLVLREGTLVLDAEHAPPAIP